MFQADRTGCSGVRSPLHHSHHQTHQHRAGREDQEPQQPAVLLQAHRTDLLWKQELLKDGNKPFVSRHSIFLCHSLDVATRRENLLTSTPPAPVCCTVLHAAWSLDGPLMVLRRELIRQCCSVLLEYIDRKDNVNNCFVVSVSLFCELKVPELIG